MQKVTRNSWKWLHSTADIFYNSITVHAYKNINPAITDILLKVETPEGEVLAEQEVKEKVYYEVFNTGNFQENDALTILFRALRLCNYGDF